MEKQEMVSSFLEIAAGQSPEIAAQFLQATSWNLEEAIQLFYLGNEGGNGAASSSFSPHVDESLSERENFITQNSGEAVGDDEVRAPMPVKRETLYGDASIVRLQPSSVIAFRNFEEVSERQAVWESNQIAASSVNGSRDNLASLYRPPFALMYHGTFDKAKAEASLLDRWLIVNLQSTEEFSSHMLNRDTWANETVAQTIRTNFIFWQVYNDSSEGKKVSTYYNLASIPAIIIIDPVTGQKMCAWSGMVQPDRLLEDLLQYMEKGPKENHAAPPHKRRRKNPEDSTPYTQETSSTPPPVLISSGIPSPPILSPADIYHPFQITSLKGKGKAYLQSMSAGATTNKTEEEDEEVALAMAASTRGIKEPVKSPSEDEDPLVEKDPETSSKEKPTYPPLPEEPKGSRELVSRVGIRLLDGRRVQRNFLRSDPIKLLWSFCFSLLEDGETRRFHLTQAIPGASKSLDYSSDQTFEEAGLANSMLSVVWD